MFGARRDDRKFDHKNPILFWKDIYPMSNQQTNCNKTEFCWKIWSIGAHNIDKVTKEIKDLAVFKTIVPERGFISRPPIQTDKIKSYMSTRGKNFVRAIENMKKPYKHVRINPELCKPIESPIQEQLIAIP